MTLPRVAETGMAASAMCWSLMGWSAEKSGTRSRNPAMVLLRDADPACLFITPSLSTRSFDPLMISISQFSISA
jgi:hypothetical protein